MLPEEIYFQSDQNMH